MAENEKSEEKQYVKCTQCLRVVEKPIGDVTVKCDNLKCPYKELLLEDFDNGC